MTNKKNIVLDSNIIIRAVLGKKVKNLLSSNLDSTRFYTPLVCYEDAEKYLPQLFIKRNESPHDALEKLRSLVPLLQIISEEEYRTFKTVSQIRIGRRDIDDWPIVACSLMLGAPIWTHDTDFFGVGIATWTTENIEIFFSED